MKISELFSQPGITYTLNDPFVTGNKNNSNSNVNTTQNTIQSQPNQLNSNNSSGLDANAINAAKQNITKGSVINVPMGPAKAKIPMKITNVTTPIGPNRQKDVTIVDPTTPKQVGQTYNMDELSKVLADEENK